MKHRPTQGSGGGVLILAAHNDHAE